MLGWRKGREGKEKDMGKDGVGSMKEEVKKMKEGAKKKMRKMEMCG